MVVAMVGVVDVGVAVAGTLDLPTAEPPSSAGKNEGASDFCPGPRYGRCDG
jgi:hypothetical protein